MKIIIITLIKGSFPFIEELSSQLENKGIEVELFDMFDMYTLKKVDDKKVVNYHLRPLILRKICNIRFLGSIIRFFFYRLYFFINPLKSDHIAIHYVLPFYTFFVNSLKKHSKSISVCIWGSDFYRVSDEKRDKMKLLLDKSDSIIIGNIKMAEEFSSYYKDTFLDKIRNVGFGIGKLDLIKYLEDNFSKAAIKESINLPISKLIITIGYNGLEAQQHLLILESFNNIPAAIKNTIFIIIPFGYGGDLIYKNSVKNKLEALNVEYRIYDNFISNEDVAKIRLITDFAINAQISDAFSASIQEHLYCNNVLLAGDWLPYSYFSNNNIKLWTFKENDLDEMVLKILSNFSYYSREVKMNKDKIYKLSSWNSRINQWINVFENKL